MKNAAKTMYTISKIFDIIEIALSGVLILVSLIISALAGSVAENPDELKGSMIALMVVGLIYIAIFIVAIVLVNKALNDVEEESNRLGIHITMIVIGAVSWNVFFLLGGIFTIIDRKKKKEIDNQEDGKDNNQESKDDNQEQENKEEN